MAAMRVAEADRFARAGTRAPGWGVSGMRKSAWALLRIVLFWGTCAGITYLSFQAIGQILPQISFEEMRLSWEGAADWFTLATSKTFAFNLAGLVTAVALGLSASFGATIICIRLLLGKHAAAIKTYRSPEVFAENFDKIRERISRSWIIGHAFREFYKTTFLEREPLCVFRRAKLTP
jgi:hypothetical protein